MVSQLYLLQILESKLKQIKTFAFTLVVEQSRLK